MHRTPLRPRAIRSSVLSLLLTCTAGLAPGFVGDSALAAAASQPATEGKSAPASQPADGGTKAPASQPAGQPYNILTTKQATGDWFGLRTQLQDVGISFQPVLATGFEHNVSGGTNTENAHDFPGIAQYNLEVDFNAKMVGIFMTPDPYKVSAGTPLAEVAAAMAERRIGSALVVDGDDRLLGIFTDTDALVAVARLAKDR